MSINIQTTYVQRKKVYIYIYIYIHTYIHHEEGIAPLTLNLGARWRWALQNNQNVISEMLYIRPTQPFMWCGQLQQNLVFRWATWNSTYKMNNYRPTSNYMSNLTVYVTLQHSQRTCTDNSRKNLFTIATFNPAYGVAILAWIYKLFRRSTPLHQGGGRRHFLIMSPRATRRYVADLMLPRTNVLSADALNSYSGWRITSGPWVIVFVLNQSLQVNTRIVTSVTPHPPLFQIHINIIQPTADKAS